MGKFRLAHGGTLFLDEIGELPLSVQSKLLRAVEQGEIEPVGGDAAVKVDVRLVAATESRFAGKDCPGLFPPGPLRPPGGAGGIPPAAAQGAGR